MRKYYTVKSFIIMYILSLLELFIQIIPTSFNDHKIGLWIIFIVQCVITILIGFIYIKNKYSVLSCWEFVLFRIISTIKSTYLLYVMYCFEEEFVFQNYCVFYFVSIMYTVILVCAAIRLKFNKTVVVNRTKPLENSGIDDSSLS